MVNTPADPSDYDHNRIAALCDAYRHGGPLERAFYA